MRIFNEIKLLYIVILLSLQIQCLAQDFGDLSPVPKIGNKWEVLTLGDNYLTKQQIISIEGLNVTTKMEGEDFETTFTVNYIIKEGICYYTSIESFRPLSKSGRHTKREFSPALRCMVPTTDMPYREEYSSTTYDFSNLSSTVVKVDRTHYYRGTEKVKTPAGIYTAQKIEIVSDTMNRILWRNKENSHIKHEVKYKDDKEASMTMLIKGTSQ